MEALAAAEKSLTGKDLDSALYNILIVEKVKNPEAAMGIASKIGDPTSRADAIGSIVSSWMELDPDSAVNRLKSFSGPDLQKILMLDLSTDIEKSVLNKMARRDPIQLISLIQKLVPSNSNEDIFKSAVFTLSNHSPDQVAGLLETLPEGDLKKSLRVTELSVLFRENPDAIVGRINDLKDEASRIEAYKAVGGMTNAENYNIALSALGELTATQKNAFIAEAIPRVAETDSVKAAEILAQSEIPGGDNRRNQLITTVASGLARDNPSYADGWMYNLPEDQQVFAMKGIAEAIARKDIRALSEKLAVFPKGKNWTAGVTVLIENLKSSDPAMAKSWQDALDVEKTK